MTDEPEDLGEVEEIESVAADPPKREWTDDDATEARAFGWKAPEEWTGDKPAGYIDDPRRYLERAENFRPFKALKERSARQEADFNERMRKLEAVSENTLKAQREQYERDLAAINRAQRDAVEVADVARFDALEKQKTAIKPPAPVEAPKPAQPAVDPYVQEYAAANDWIKNPVLRETGAKLIDANPAIRAASARDQIAYAEAEVRKLYPGAFAPVADTRPAPPSRVDGGGLGIGASGANSFSKLPGEAKAAFQKFVGQGIFANTPADQKRYADDYNAA